MEKGPEGGGSAMRLSNRLGDAMSLLGLWGEGPPPKTLDERIRLLEGEITQAREALSSVKELADAARLLGVRIKELQGHFHFDHPCSGRCSQQIAKFWQAHAALQTAVACYDEVRKRRKL